MERSDCVSLPADTQEESSGTSSRWNSYDIYRLMLCSWMVSDVVTVTSVTEMSHHGFYIRFFVHLLGVLFIGIPLVYSEICIAQYTNCSIVKFWDCFPLFRGLSYGMIFLCYMKCVYMVVLTSWYFKYTFYSIFGIPPWFSCDRFQDFPCMVKRINVTLFQHCVEMERLVGFDCGMKTASNLFFVSEIGNKTTKHDWPQCFYSWKEVTWSSCICVLIYLMSYKTIKWIQIAIKIVTIYISLGGFILLCVSLSIVGVWNTEKVVISWPIFDTQAGLDAISDSFLTLGTGYGMITFLSNDVHFRSPATMTSILAALCSVFTTFMLSFVAFNGIKAMSFYHGEEFVVEIDSNAYFPAFASMAEVLSYFNGVIFWTFTWFSIIFLSLIMNMWLLSMQVINFFLNTSLSRYDNVVSFCLMACIFLTTMPMYCCDIATAVVDAIELIQIVCSLFVSITVYWLYGLKKHNVDILFMLGIKASLYLKILWFFNPPIMIVLLYSKVVAVEVYVGHQNSYYIDAMDMDLDEIIFLSVVGLFAVIVIIGTIIEIFTFISMRNLRGLIFPVPTWGPKDPILFRSRKMFVPEIMTREFLYRQVRIYGKNRQVSTVEKMKKKESLVQVPSDNMKWSPLTSN